MKVYFYNVFLDKMVPPCCTIVRRSLHPEEVAMWVNKGVYSILNDLDTILIKMLKSKFNISVNTGNHPVNTLHINESIIIVDAKRLPNLMKPRDFTPEEIFDAEINFSMWTVIST